MAVAMSKDEAPSAGAIFQKAVKRALGGGIPGAAAMVCQVLTLMWLRTTVNYQYRYGTSTLQALRTLYGDGGVPRFYKGVGWALIQGPLSRFGDTAANTGALAVFESVPSLQSTPVPIKTFCASFTAACFRILLTPVDTFKTMNQVEGARAAGILSNKIAKSGPGVLYNGAFGAAAATLVGHYPWFVTFNYLNESIPQAEGAMKFVRSAFIGFCCSFVSDCCSNSIRVLKTTKQTAAEEISYIACARMIIEKEGLRGLFFRGLGTKIITNGCQGIMFTVLWRYFMEILEKREAALPPPPPPQPTEAPPAPTATAATPASYYPPSDLGIAYSGTQVVTRRNRRSTEYGDILSLAVPYEDC